MVQKLVVSAPGPRLSKADAGRLVAATSCLDFIQR